MALVFKDRIKETTTTTGQGTITLAGAVDGFRSFADVGNSNTTYYVIYDNTAYTWEVGLGTYTASGTTLSRDTVLQTSSGNTTKINLGAGSKEVFVSSPAGKHVYLDASGDLTINGTTYLNAIHNRWTKTATSNQTVFTGSDNSGATLSVSAHTQVFLNGILLEASDYTIGGTTTVTLGSGASASDIVEIISFAPFTTASALQPSNNLSDVSSASTARTNLGLGDASTKTVGIGSGNVGTFASGVADDDFLKIDGTTIEGRSSAEVLSDIGGLSTSVASSTYAPLAGATFTGDVSGTNATLTGYLRGPSSFTIDPATHGDDTGTVVIAGNLQVDGTTTTINSTTVAIDDLNFSIATDASDSASANGAGITIGGAGATMLYTHATTSWDFNKPIIAAGGIVLDSDAGEISLKDGGVEYVQFKKDSDNVQVTAGVQSGDIVFRGNDDGSMITALTLDMSEAGEAIFNSGATFGSKVGIGDNNPGKALTINGSDWSSSSIGLTRTGGGADNDAGISFTSSAGANDDTGLGGIWFNNSLDSNCYALIRARTDDASGTSGKLEFMTGTSAVGNGTAPSMLIDSSGHATFSGNVILPQTGILAFNSTSDEYVSADNSNVYIGVNNGWKIKATTAGAEVQGTLSATSDITFSSNTHKATGERAQNIHLKTGSTNDYQGLYLTNSDGDSANSVQLYGDSTAYGFLNGVWGSWDVKKVRGGDMVLNGSHTVVTSSNVGTYASGSHWTTVSNSYVSNQTSVNFSLSSQGVMNKWLITGLRLHAGPRKLMIQLSTDGGSNFVTSGWLTTIKKYSTQGSGASHVSGVHYSSIWGSASNRYGVQITYDDLDYSNNDSTWNMEINYYRPASGYGAFDLRGWGKPDHTDNYTTGFIKSSVQNQDINYIRFVNYNVDTNTNYNIYGKFTHLQLS